MTNSVFIARSATQLAQINQFIHDQWFYTDDISFDDSAAVVTIRFTRPVPERERRIGRAGPLHKVEVPYCESFLRIHHARHWHVEDLQRVEMYDLNEVTYDSAAKTVRITTGIPITLFAEVDELEVSVEESGKIAAVKVRRKLI
ncbi:MAG TPA: hypothetical protein VKK31_07020 [Thermoanaerobaculia bacterium]|nr:hypothetical protein [Thermoanaerobaculia bacterium]